MLFDIGTRKATDPSRIELKDAQQIVFVSVPIQVQVVVVAEHRDLETLVGNLGATFNNHSVRKLNIELDELRLVCVRQQ